MVALALAIGLGLILAGEETPADKPVRPEFFRPPTKRPILSEISTRVHVAATADGQTGVVTLPVPSDYSGQTVVAFRVQTEPPSALKSWKWITRPDGLNPVVKATVAAGPKGIAVGYTALTILPGEGVVRTQSKNFSPWLGSSARVQSTDPEIATLAKKLHVGADSRSAFVGRVVKWVATNKLRQNLSPGISNSKSALNSGGDSLGRANLCAAILRAGGIAARTLATIPTWAERMDAEWWIVEYWSDDGNWQMIDPTVGIQHPSRNSAVVLSISSVADENESLARASALRPDAPVLTTPEISARLTWSTPASEEPTTTIRVIKVFPNRSGGRLLMTAFRRNKKVVQSAQNGQSEWIDEGILQKVIAKGPINLALYLDGQPTMPDRQ